MGKPDGVGDTLYALVEAYAAIGHHRTGTVNDAATIDWFASALRDRGGDVELQPYGFDRYDATWTVTAGGREIDSLPLFYEGVGTATVAGAAATDVDAFALMFGVTPDPDGVDLAVLRTTGTTGRLVVPNRAPKAPDGTPAVLVAGSAPQDGYTVEFDARIVEGSSSNVVARFSPSQRPLVIATPLSGWFTCAGERGTGIAVALELAAHIASDVIVIGTTGHELVDLGLRRLIEAGDVGEPSAILHLGASLAAGSDGALSSTRLATVSAPADDRIDDALGAIGITPTHLEAAEASDPARWLGEAKEWCALGVPLVSITGHFPAFHTPQDTPDEATTPQLLQRAYAAAEACAAALSS